ncbi:MBL fold metallo-hydrolase, partial [Patescibacteria group bacterium]|nr:MBL fold metallo-hydrolase [Patescibacteria group bacterium]
KNIAGAEIIKAEESKNIAGVKIMGVEGYNLKIPNHQKGKDLGFIVEMQGKRIYHAGDTDLIEEMKQIKNIDLALLPVGGTYTMDVDQAVEAVKLIQPKVVIPMHYGKIKLGSQEFELKADIDDFKNKVEQLTKTKAVVLSPSQEYILE